MTTTDGDLGTDLARVEELLRAVSRDGSDAHHGALGHLVFAGGKRLRPRLTLSSGRTVSGEPLARERAVRAAAAVELLHVGTLHHDDVMDESTTRRNQPSVNTKWGNAAAILSGDVLIGRAMRLVASLGAAETDLLAETLETVCAGQAQETRSLHDAGRGVRDYLDTIERKTAALFATSCRLGAMTAGADDGHITRLGEFGRQLGVAFQLVDDVMDLVSSTTTLGKPVGSDLREGNLTLAVIDALERVPTLRSLLWKPESVEQVCRVVVDSGAVERALERAAGHVEHTRRVLTTLRDATGYLGQVVGMVETLLRNTADRYGSTTEPAPEKQTDRADEVR